MTTSSKTTWRKSDLAAGAAGLLALGIAVGAFAAPPLHGWSSGDTLKAKDLNDNFQALQDQITALQQQIDADAEPFRGTAPMVSGLGNGLWFCTDTIPTTVNLAAPSPTAVLSGTNEFGSVIFTDGGTFSMDVSLGYADLTSVPKPTNVCPNNVLVCAAPLTFFLKSPNAQTIPLHIFPDDKGAVYIDGALQTQVTTTAGAVSLVDVQVPSGSFALTILACSQASGTTLWEGIFDKFVNQATYGITVDYDRTFHRG